MERGGAWRRAKKLVEAGRLWASGGPKTQQIDEGGALAAMRSAGASPTEIQRVRAQLHAREVQQPPFLVWPCNWYAFQVFNALDTQWRIASAGAKCLRVGLDYSAIGPVIQAFKNHPHRVSYSRLLQQLKTLEGVVLTVQNEENRA